MGRTQFLSKVKEEIVMESTVANLIEAGKKLGLADKALRDFVQKQQERENEKLARQVE